MIIEPPRLMEVPRGWAVMLLDRPLVQRCMVDQELAREMLAEASAVIIALLVRAGMDTAILDPTELQQASERIGELRRERSEAGLKVSIVPVVLKAKPDSASDLAPDPVLEAPSDGLES